MHKPHRLIALGVVLSLALVACGDSSDDGAASQPDTSSSTGTVTAPPTWATTAAPATTTPTRAEPAIEVALAGGQVVGGLRKETVNLGDQVRIRATSDVPEVLHVHTYNLKADVQPGTPGEVVFEATIPGRHEVEFEKSGKDALTLEVR